MINGVEILKSFIKKNKIKYMFGNPGTTEATTLEAIADNDDIEYILSLHESVAIGMAAGYSLATDKVGFVNIHTYPGLANSMCNMYNAYVSGIPLFITAGQQTRDSLIHAPVLSGDLTKLAETATKNQYEVTDVKDLYLALHRGYTQSQIFPQAPTFLSIPMDVMNDKCESPDIKVTTLLDNSTIQDADVSKLSLQLANVPKGELVFIADYEVSSSKAQYELEVLANVLEADVYTAPFHVAGCIATNSIYYKGTLPKMGDAMVKALSKYSTVVILGEKINMFLSKGVSLFGADQTIIQISKSSQALSFDYACDIAFFSDIKYLLKAVITKMSKPEIGLKKIEKSNIDLSVFEDTKLASKLYKILQSIDIKTRLVTDGSSFDSMVQEISLSMFFSNVHFSPRGGGLGWAMPLATGLSLATNKHSVCFVGDGGSMYSIQSVWSAAKYNIPVIYICVYNREYKILKELAMMQKGVKSKDDITFVGLDLDNPAIGLDLIAKGFGAEVHIIESENDIVGTMSVALKHMGPSFIILK